MRESIFSAVDARLRGQDKQLIKFKKIYTYSYRSASMGFR
jgi:hypothetical protein